VGAEPAAAPPKPLHSWALDQLFAADTVGGRRAVLEAPAGSATDRAPALVFDGVSTSLTVPEITAADLPRREITAECCVALDQPQPWGGLLGYFQDNGDDEKGWLLGYAKDAFCFAVSTHRKLTYLTAPRPATPGRWYHVTGTYDGQTMRLYLNGREVATSQEQSGDIDYPPKALYVIGAYRDDNEDFRFQGKLRDIRLYAQALSPDQVRARSAAVSALTEQRLEFAVPPRALHLPALAAEVTWDLPTAAGAWLEYCHGTSPAVRRESRSQGTHHTLRIEGLARDTEYTVRIHAGADEEERVSEPFTIDTTFDYERPPVPDAVPTDAAQAAMATRLIPDPDRARGLCLVYGLNDGGLVVELARRSHYRVSAWDEDPERVAALRRRLLQEGLYGQQITVHQVPTLAALPLGGGLADLVVSEALAEGRLPGTMTEVVRLLCPGIGRAELGPLGEPGSGDLPAPVEAWLAPSPVRPVVSQAEGRSWATLARPALPGAGAWTHQYGDAGNSANSWDALHGASATTDLVVQWLGRPGADFGIDRNPRMPAPLVADGRLFHQGMNRLAALNAFNGTILWTLESPALRRVNLPRDAGNWCTDGTSLFVVLDAACLELDAATGRERRVLRLPEAAAPAASEWGYVARAGSLLLGSATQPGASYREFWGAEAWYDGRTGPGTEKVCSAALFALAVAEDPPRPAWVYPGGAILNSTIACSGDSVFLVESRQPNLGPRAGARLGDELWRDTFLVGLDLESGKRRWEAPIEGRPRTTVVFLSAVPGAVVLAASAQGEYRLTCFDPQTGTQRWSAAHPWPSDNHGGHLQHPVLSADTVFLEPFAYRLASGERLPDPIGKHEGCATYAGIQDALLYRGQGRCVALWGIHTGAVTTWPQLRPSCWLNTVAGSGLILIPEGGGGCSCGGWLETSIGFAPKALQEGAP